MICPLKFAAIGNLENALGKVRFYYRQQRYRSAETIKSVSPEHHLRSSFPMLGEIAPLPPPKKTGNVKR
jgi:hypothetical protein